MNKTVIYTLTSYCDRRIIIKERLCVSFLIFSIVFVQTLDSVLFQVYSPFIWHLKCFSKVFF